jgi:thioredoxin reductase
MRDKIPDRPGFYDLFGKGVYVCPYCDGWENRDRRLAAYAPAHSAAETALALLTWSSDVVLFTAGQEKLAETDREHLLRNGITLVYEDDIAALEGKDGRLAAVVLTTGARIERDALFLHLGEEQAAPFAKELGCEIGENGTVTTGKGERAGPPGVFVAGDASHDLQLVSIALAEGVKAACAINTDLRKLTQR